MKRSKQQLENIKEDISLCKQEINDTGDQTFRLYTERVLEHGGLVTDQIEHQRLCAQREARSKLVNFGQQFARCVKGGRDHGKSKIRRFFERVFGGANKKKEAEFQQKLNVDINSMLFSDVMDSRIEIVEVLKNIGGGNPFTSLEEKNSSSIKAMARDLAHKLRH